MKKHTFLILGAMILFSFAATPVMAQKQSPASGGQGKKGSPFLIVGKMPHLTKLLMQQWDNPTLNLSAEQKEQLLVIRKRTIGGVRHLAPKIATLENQVAEGIARGKTPEELADQVQSIAQLKSEATLLHLRCIYDTDKILNQQQRDFLRGR